MAGKFYSATFTTSAGADLMTQFRSAVGNSGAVVRACTLIADAELHVKINGGEYSELYLDTDAKYKLTIPNEAVLISSLLTQEASVSVWMAGVY